MDMVATRARAGKAALYRRWSSKAELVVDSLALHHPTLPEPDIGTLLGVGPLARRLLFYPNPPLCSSNPLIASLISTRSASERRSGGQKRSTAYFWLSLLSKSAPSSPQPTALRSAGWDGLTALAWPCYRSGAYL